MKKVLKCIWDHYDDALAFVTFVGLFLVVLFQMVARSVFNFGFVWTEELSRLLLMYACFSSLPVILKTRKELKLTLLTDRLSARNQHIFDILVAGHLYCDLRLPGLLWLQDHRFPENKHYGSHAFFHGVYVCGVPNQHALRYYPRSPEDR